MMKTFNMTTIIFLMATWMVSMAVVAFEIVRILRKSRKIEEERLRRAKGDNLKSDLFDGAGTACSAPGGGGHGTDRDHSLCGGTLFEEKRPDPTCMLETDEKDAELFHRLVFLQIGGEASGWVQILNRRESCLGRDRNLCDICVNDSCVSSRHAVIVCDGEVITVRNYAEPRNPTYIDGRPLFGDESAELDEGAEVRIAKTVFKVYHRRKADMERDALSES